MKKTISLTCNGASLIIFLSVCRFWDNSLIFLLSGSIPGTTISLSPSLMMALIVLAIALAGLAIFHPGDAKKIIHPGLPKKRYSRV